MEDKSLVNGCFLLNWLIFPVLAFYFFSWLLFLLPFRLYRFTFPWDSSAGLLVLIVNSHIFFPVSVSCFYFPKSYIVISDIMVCVHVSVAVSVSLPVIFLFMFSQPFLSLSLLLPFLINGCLWFCFSSVYIVLSIVSFHHHRLSASLLIFYSLVITFTVYHSVSLHHATYLSVFLSTSLFIY